MEQMFGEEESSDEARMGMEVQKLVGRDVVWEHVVE